MSQTWDKLAQAMTRITGEATYEYQNNVVGFR